MATGSYSTKGVWQYGEDDSESTFSGLLNKLASSTSNVLPTVCTSSTRPGTPYTGQVIYETDTSRTYIYNGSAWKFTTGLAAPQKVADNTERGTLFPSPVQGNQVFNNTTKMRETYYDAVGSPARSAGWYSGQDGGLVPIIPPTVTVGSGSASVSANGNVSFTGATSIMLNGIFTSAYDHYKIFFWSAQASASLHTWQFGYNGTPITSGYYGAGLIVGYVTALAANGQQNNQGFGYFNGASITSALTSEMTIYPNSTSALFKCESYTNGNATRSLYGYNIGGGANNPTDIKLYTHNGVTFSGTVEVYGIRK